MPVCCRRPGQYGIPFWGVPGTPVLPGVSGAFGTLLGPEATGPFAAIAFRYRLVLVFRLRRSCMVRVPFCGGPGVWGVRYGVVV